MTGDEIERLARLISSAFDEDELERVVHTSTGDRLFDIYVGRGKPGFETATDLLNKLDKSGNTEIFLAHVWKRKPAKLELRRFIADVVPDLKHFVDMIDRSVNLDLQQGGSSEVTGSTNALAPGFQRNLQPLIPDLDARVWVTKLLAAASRICRVETRGKGLGTGFLVGPDLVLTNWHVVSTAIGGAGADLLECRFDYEEQLDGTAFGTPIRVVNDGCISHSVTGPDPANGGMEPTLEQLDYALLRIERIPDPKANSSEPRGWIKLPAERVSTQTGEPIMILQHPLGGPMKLALDTKAVVGLNNNGTRLQYLTNTDKGSSGSPCFTIEWRPVALHGSTIGALPDGRNQGTPLELVAKSIRAKSPNLLV